MVAKVLQYPARRWADTVMYNPDFKNRLITDLAALKEAGLYKQERYISTPQFSEVGLKDGSKVINMCANNYSAT